MELKTILQKDTDLTRTIAYVIFAMISADQKEVVMDLTKLNIADRNNLINYFLTQNIKVLFDEIENAYIFRW